jgi:hypothetical protein
LVEQQLEVFLITALVGGAGLNADQALLLKARLLEFFFLFIQLLDLLVTIIHLKLQVFDLFFQLAHFAFGLFQVLLNTRFIFLQLVEQFF